MTGAASERRRKPTGDTRERILEVAEELVARHGMEGLRLKDVAERVGIQPPSVFAHFGGREAIGDAVAHRVLSRIAEALGAELSRPDSPERRLRAGVRTVAEHLYDHPGHTRLILRDLARTRTGDELSLWSPEVVRLVDQVDALLAEGAREGAFREVPTTSFFPMIEGAIVAMIGWAGFQEDGRPSTSASRAQIVERVEDLAWSYVRPVAAPS